MEFKVNSKEFEKLLSKIFPAIPSKTPVQALEHFKFEIKDGLLTVSGTDLDISLKSSINVDTSENFEGLVPAKRIYELVRSFGDTTLHFQIDYNHALFLVTDKGKYKLFVQRYFLLNDSY